MINKVLKYFLENKLVTVLLVLLLTAWGLATAPFGWNLGGLPTDPVAVDAIPDIGENQQIIFTKWPGRSPQDIEDQITYPLTTSLLGIPGVKSIRSSSVFGFSSIYLVFNEDVEFYWSRSRILEKLNSLPSGLLPDGVQPALGPDATALGQVFWYTIEGRDEQGNPTGGWDLHEIRTVQDFYVKYGLSSAEGVAEVASIGGFVKEYQVDVDPSALKAYDVSLQQVVQAVKNSNQDIGAKTIEINNAEYLVRGLGYVKKIEDIEQAVVRVNDNVPIRVRDIGVVSLGPAHRRGVLDKGGAEVAGGVAIARYGANPLEVINNVKDKIKEINPGLPQKKLEDGTVSKLTIVPFYDRTELIYETLGTLEEALSLEVLITIIVVIVMVTNLRASFMITSLLPLAVLMVFIAMKLFNIPANIVALSGIAIAIGTMVDLAVILSENIIKHLKKAPKSQRLITTVYNGASEVSSAILTAVSTTIVSFIPVFTMEAAEGKLFRPLAFTKTFALVAALIITLLILPAIAHWFFSIKVKSRSRGMIIYALLAAFGIWLLFVAEYWASLTLLGLSAAWALKTYLPWQNKWLNNLNMGVVVLSAAWLLARYWMPLGPHNGMFGNFAFICVLVFAILAVFQVIEHYYTSLLQWCLQFKKRFLLVPVILIALGACIWLGFNNVFGFAAKGFEAVGLDIRSTLVWEKLTGTFPGVGEEFMPALDEGSFLLMPTTMPHAGIEESKRTLQQLDMLVQSIPEVSLVVGKLGRVESALDPAPISMFENIIQYKPEYATDKKGHRIRFKTGEDGGFLLRSGGTVTNIEALEQGIESDRLIPGEDGQYFRNWRPHIRNTDDIWNEISRVTNLPGVTSAPKLQPIETRLIMLQTGMRAPMGIKVFGPDLETIEAFGEELEVLLRQVEGVKAEAVFADRIVGKPYIHLNIDRNKVARYGLNVIDVQQTIETAVGGKAISYTVEGRERYPIRVRYPRELRDDPESLKQILVNTANGTQVPLGQMVDIEYVRGPQMIKSENTFLVGYVLFDKKDGFAEVEVVNNAQRFLEKKIQLGELQVSPGINYKFSGNYENQVRAEKRLSIIVPLVLVIVFLILFFQFRSVSTSFMVFSGIAMAFSGGFIMIWLYGQEWVAGLTLLGVNFGELFQVHPVNLSVAVWVGFIALFGIATDDGVLIATYLDQSFKRNKPTDIRGVRNAVVEAGQKRIKPALMTVSTTMIALMPVLSSTGRGADIMIPMAIPTFGGMAFALISIFIVPVLYCWREERKIKKNEQS